MAEKYVCTIGTDKTQQKKDWLGGNDRFGGTVRVPIAIIKKNRKKIGMKEW